MHCVYNDMSGLNDFSPDKELKPVKYSNHPVMKVLGIALAIFIVVSLGLFIADEFKSDEQRLSDYTGTWQACSISKQDDPVRLALTFFASQTTGIGDHFVMGISDGLGQLSAYGILKGYSFELKGKEAIFRDEEGNVRLTAKIQLGYMTITDTSGTATGYKKVSDTYILADENVNNVDTESLADTAKMILDASGYSNDVEIFDIVDEQALAYKLQNVDPETLQEVIGSVDISAVANGDYENALDTDDPAVQKLITSVGAEAAADGEVSVEEGFAIAEQYGITAEEARQLAEQYGYEIP